MKRKTFISLILVFSLLVFLLVSCGDAEKEESSAEVSADPFAGHTVTGVVGDIDGNGYAEKNDLDLISKHIKGELTLPDDLLDAADVDGNGMIDDADVSFLQDYIDRKTMRLPKGCAHEEGKKTRDENGNVVISCPTCGLVTNADIPTGVKVAYIPIDDRPVNLERVQYLAESVGIDLLMPERDLYRTCLDNMSKNKNGTTYGDREKLLEWVKKTDEECDYFIISLDQMLSGGLVSSRWLDNTDLTFEYKIADEIISLCENNTVVLFDTVMRLASTINYMGYDYDEYTKLREYGRAGRKVIDAKDLTIENIIAGYRYDENGKEISTELPDEAITKYLASRRRKIVLADYILKNAGDDINFIYYGVDDSRPQTTVQTNEINYIKGLIGDRGVLSAACDELGLCCLTRVVGLIYGSVGVNVEYFGPGKDRAADEWDISTLASNIETHLVCFDTKDADDGDDALDILVLTRDCDSTDRQNLLNRINENIKNDIPTAVVNVSGDAQTFGSLLANECDDICRLLGYSSWNSAGNAMGISMSLGIARYTYLNAVGVSSVDANEGFLKSMTFAYAKDISYKGFHTYIDGWLTGDYQCSVKQILAKLNEGKMVTSVLPYTAEEHAQIAVAGARYPWDREFEATFTIRIKK